MSGLAHILLALAVIIAVARLFGVLFRRLGQPPVIGEVLAGILLGPSLLGRFVPDSQTFLFPTQTVTFLGQLSQVGVLLYMFVVGLELDAKVLRTRVRAPIAISQASIIVPFALGAAVAVWLYPQYAPSGVSTSVFALFLAVSMSVTAFPVLARILTDQGIHRTRLGTIALACAAVDDVTAWCLLAFLVSTVRAEAASVFYVMGLTAGYIAAMLLIVRPLALGLVRSCERRGSVSQSVLALVVVALLLSGLCAELIGIHALFGAFLIGAIIPHDSLLARELIKKVQDLVLVLLLPAFFAVTGMRTQIGLVDGAHEWLVCGVLVAVASLGKFGGSSIAARLTGLAWRESMVIGLLMNTRGLMELVVLNVGLKLGVVSPTLFAMLVIMALVTTLATAPLLQALRTPALFDDGSV